MRPSRQAFDVLLVSLLLLAVFLLELLLVPEEVMGLLYIVPVLLAAPRLSPAATVLTAGMSVALYGFSATQGHLGPVVSTEHVLAHLLTLIAVAFLGFQVAVRIQEARQAQRAAEAAHETAEGALQSLQNFLGMVAHDLRGPLTSILGSAQLAERAQMPPDVRARALVTVQTEARRMDRLLADLTDAARVGAGAFQVQPQPSDLVVVARQVVQGQQAGAPRHRIALHGPSSLEGVWDPDRLVQVLTNLVSNAVKYSREGGEITVRLAREDERAVVSVSDQGQGIRPDDLPRLFQPFSRLQPERGTRGAGLGLYIARAIVQAHGGRIWATSPGPGKGTTFTFTLPISARRAGTGEQAA